MQEQGMKDGCRRAGVFGAIIADFDCANEILP